jgi:hypothetical protein
MPIPLSMGLCSSLYAQHADLQIISTLPETTFFFPPGSVFKSPFYLSPEYMRWSKYLALSNIKTARVMCHAKAGASGSRGLRKPGLQEAGASGSRGLRKPGLQEAGASGSQFPGKNFFRPDPVIDAPHRYKSHDYIKHQA